MKIDWSRLGRAIVDIREICGISIRDLAKDLKISHSAISRVENGKPVSAGSFLSLCSFVGTDPRNFAKEPPHDNPR